MLGVFVRKAHAITPNSACQNNYLSYTCKDCMKKVPVTFQALIRVLGHRSARPQTSLGVSLQWSVEAHFQRKQPVTSNFTCGANGRPAGATSRPLSCVVLPKRGGRGLQPQKEVREREKRSGNREQKPHAHPSPLPTRGQRQKERSCMQSSTHETSKHNSSSGKSNGSSECCMGASATTEAKGGGACLVLAVGGAIGSSACPQGSGARPS